MNRKLLYAFLFGAALIALWWYIHQRCPTCQEKWAMLKNKKWAMLKNKLGSRMIEPKPGF